MDVRKFLPPPPTLPVEYQFDFHLNHNPDHPAFMHPRSDGTFKTYTYSDIVPAIHHCANYFLSQICASPGKTPIIAIVGTSDALTYSVALMGILRAGMTAFPISPRFSVEIIALLINAVKPSYMLVSSTKKQIIEDIKLCLSSDNRPVVLEIPTYEIIFHGEPRGILNKHDRSLDQPALIIHSSGSTSLHPKTIKWSSKFYLNNAETKALITQIDFAPIDFERQIFGLQGLEPFHSFGLCCLSWMTRVGFTISLLNPKDDASLIPANHSTIYENLKRVSPSVAYIWSQDSEKRNFLKTLLVMTGGRVLSKACAQKLIDSDVQLTIGYGSTESGSITVFNSSALNKKDWQYFRPFLRETKFIRRDDGFSSMIVVSTPTRELPLCNTTYQGLPGYDPGDLFLEHTTHIGHFSVVGRLSDQLILSSGEVVNPEELGKILPSS
ncbi:hypothetical protein EV368DRAFT_68346 [Lentinula lateritia]|uniref:Uncharacterized protein n=1 Tax=Lentinula aff. lateritia TaxID=2804960 RepID=A0ACC1TPE0_9AGAR|nr:hypothetical protein F5876DRAFT_68792 [Lentinula aff. lateritia]KAJ3848347.1 hypothetical protein EV368DRAFT_68346 [Lentinula lateritia]